MPITIGGQSLATTRPDDLDAQLVAATGCNAAEMAAIVSGPRVGAVMVARALAPFLAADAPRGGELAAEIALDDPSIVGREVAKLLREPAAVSVQAAATIPPVPDPVAATPVAHDGTASA